MSDVNLTFTRAFQLFFYFTHLPNYCGLNSSAQLNRNNENKHGYLVTLEEKKSSHFSPISVSFTVELPCMSFIFCGINLHLVRCSLFILYPTQHHLDLVINSVNVVNHVDEFAV
jgi:hypothetical protein